MVTYSYESIISPIPTTTPTDRIHLQEYFPRITYKQTLLFSGIPFHFQKGKNGNSYIYSKVVINMATDRTEVHPVAIFLFRDLILGVLLNYATMFLAFFVIVDADEKEVVRIFQYLTLVILTMNLRNCRVCIFVVF